MNRIIKFRAYTEISNEVLGMKYDVPHNYNDTVMQFTGLLDKNGKEIYEGDIVRGQHKIIGDWTAKVDFLATGIWFGGAKFSEVENYEIIGNIYENPELLK